MVNALLYDSTLCIGCRACESGCSEKWGLPYNDTIAAEEKLSVRKLTTIVTSGDKFSRRKCMHCVEPACASVCPVAALHKTAAGPVLYDQEKCIGCRYCMAACPFGAPSYEWTSRTPRVRKCDACSERVAKGEPTACSTACPTAATISGDRDELIREAQKRLREKPGEYYQKIYGLNEVGGTTTLYLSAVPFETLGLRGNLPKEALPHLTWQVLQAVPDVAGVGSVLLGGVYWLTHRREEVARAEATERRTKR
ncbi:MAG: 4Fe-4S dicluster domain-containing protein [Bryobacteraceae bacterium]|nr:4Fe-4S dicluster domain-containing protein [Bryobacteraceae bacterium]